jgi:hypothetical protein
MGDESLSIIGTLTRRGQLLKAGTVQQILKTDGDVMPGIKDPDQLSKQVPVLASSPDMKNDPRGVFRHIFTAAALTQATNVDTSREIMTNHDKHLNKTYPEYVAAMKAEGKKPLSMKEIYAGGLVEKPKSWTAEKMKDFGDTLADIGNNEIGYKLGQSMGGNYDRNVLAGKVADTMATQGGFMARFNNGATQMRILNHKITPTQQGKINRRSQQLIKEANPQPQPRPTPAVRM